MLKHGTDPSSLGLSYEAHNGILVRKSEGLPRAVVRIDGKAITVIVGPKDRRAPTLPVSGPKPPPVVPKPPFTSPTPTPTGTGLLPKHYFLFPKGTSLLW